MEWRPAGWTVCLPLLIFPCTIKSRSSLLAQAHPGGPGKRAVKQLWWWWVSPKIRVLPSLLYGTCPKLWTEMTVMLCCHGMSTTASVVNLVWLSQVYHTERPPLFSTHLPWCNASRGFVCNSSDLYDRSIKMALTIGHSGSCWKWAMLRALSGTSQKWWW